jgi:Bacterial Ig-like domain (group 3)/Right handed beta helix region
MSIHVGPAEGIRRSVTCVSLEPGSKEMTRPIRGAGRQRTRRRTPELLRLENRQLLSTFDVTSTADDGSTGTLRWAVQGANADTSPCTIVLELGTTAATITLTQGALDLTNTSQPVSIEDGTGQGPVTINGDYSVTVGVVSVFEVESGVTASLSGMTITGVVLPEIGGSAMAVRNYGDLTLSGCTVSGNSGLGIYSGSQAALLTLTDCTISGNSGGTVGGSLIEGGGLANRGTASLTDCDIIDNSAGAGDTFGGGVDNTGTATLVDCTLTGNSADSGGGLANAFGTLTLTGCTIGSNSAYGGGGLATSGTATLTNCTISGNSANSSTGLVGGGGGLYIDYGGSATLAGCTISGNSSANSGGGMVDGGGLGNEVATLDLTDCTISGNSAGGSGGGVYARVYGATALTACTVSGNSAANSGGGLYNTDEATTTLVDTIVAGNTANADGDIDTNSGTLSGSYNLIGTGGSGGLANGTDGNIVLTSLADLNLGLLADNGGPTETMALLPGSPAIGAGTAVSGVTTDQRAQPLDSPPDIGAYQTQTQTSQPISLSFTGLTSPNVAYGTASVTLSGRLANGDQAPPDTESVQITLDGVMQSAAIGSAGAFSTTFETSSLGVSGSPYTISYSYTGDGTFASTSTSGTLTVSKATPTVRASDAGGKFTGSPFPGAATITGINGTASSSLEGVTPVLTYYAGTAATGTPLGGAPSQGGTYTVVASFAGSADYKPVQSAPVTFTIQPAVASVTLTSSVTTSIYGQPIALVAKVTGSGATPGGAVTFADGGIILGTVPLDGSGEATLTTLGVPAGSSSITASYGGSADFLPASSAPFALSVTAAVTQPAVLAPQAVVQKKQVVSVDLMVQFGPLSAASSPPSGTATFEEILKARGKGKSREKLLGTAPLVNGRASLSLKTQKVLNQKIEVVYAGDANYQSATVMLPVVTKKMLKALG